MARDRKPEREEGASRSGYDYSLVEVLGFIASNAVARRLRFGTFS